jgi:hypothetical protein
MLVGGVWPYKARFKKGKLNDEKIKIIDKTNAEKYAFCLNTVYKRNSMI